MNEAEKNYQVTRQVEDARRFLLEMYAHNPALLKTADQRIRELFQHKQTTVQTFKQRGISLIELIMFIVIVSVALAGILLVMNVTTKGSADPLVHKQALAIAESLLEEVELMPFTYCDPNDPSGNAGDPVLTTSTASCTAGWSQDVITGPTPNTETRYSTSDPFDNVADYSGCQMNTGVANPGCDSTGTGGIKDITNPAIAALNGYKATVDIFRAGLALGLPVDDAALRIRITVTGPDGVDVVVEGIRTRYAPNAVP